ncbi:MAG: RHS repeat-associated core domain-containing protein [Bacteroidota bacterium]
MEYEYHPVTGLVERILFQKGVGGEQFIHRYGYDVQDRLILVETSTDDLQYVTQAQYEYYETGALKRTELAGGVQGVDYVYNLAGQLKSLNHPSLAGANDPGGNTNDLFGMQLDYHNNDYQRPLGNITAATYGTDQLNGNIKGIRWNNYQGNNEAPVAYSYSYDRNNWLTDAHFGQYGDGSNSNILPNEEDTGTYTNADGPIVIQGTSSVTLLPNFHAQQGSDVTVRIAVGEGFNPLTDGDYNVTGIGYDANGNIQTLTRNKHNADDGTAMDNLTYVYKTDKPNQLLRVEDSAMDVVGAEDIGTQTGNNYEYNAIGQLTRNNSEGISYFYNASGLVTEIQKANKPVLKLYYNDRNHRIKKERFQSDGSTVAETTYYVRDVAGQVLGIYTENTSMPLALRETPVYGQDRIGVYKHEDGGTDVTYYELKDHLGNVRVLFTRNGTDALGESYTDYFPFGSPMPGRNIVGDYRYAFQGQEKDPETGMEAFQLRLWDSRIGRWLTPDPYNQFHSPYLGMGNNPINGVDPDGGCFTTDKDGNTIPCPDMNVGSTMTGSAGFEWTMQSDGWARSDGFEVLVTAQRPVYENYRTLPGISIIPDDIINKSFAQLGSSQGEDLSYLGDFTSANDGLTFNQVITQRKDRSKTSLGSQPGGPDIRYIQDPINPSAVIDLRHMLYIGSKGPYVGNSVELLQALGGQKSAGDFQDAYSNFLGYQFHNAYKSKLESNPTKFADYLTEFLISSEHGRLHPNMGIQFFRRAN